MLFTKSMHFFLGYQYGYGIPGLPGAFNPFLINPGWLDAAYMSYAWPDYFRSRPANFSQQPNIHTSLVKGKIRVFNIIDLIIDL